jgi:hypothetical protein
MRSWHNFKVLYRHLPGRTEENHEKSRSRSPISGARLESGTSEYETGVLTILL